MWWDNRNLHFPVFGNKFAFQTHFIPNKCYDIQNNMYFSFFFKTYISTIFYYCLYWYINHYCFISRYYNKVILKIFLFIFGFNIVNWIRGFTKKFLQTITKWHYKMNSGHWVINDLYYIRIVYVSVDVSNGPLSISKWFYLQYTKIRLLRIHCTFIRHYLDD